MAEIIDEPGLRNRVHVFDDRFHAGELLAERLDDYKEERDVQVLAIPAGGVQVAYQVSKRLGLPLDVAVTRKIHIPWNREAGFGAVSIDRSRTVKSGSLLKKLEKFYQMTINR